MNSTKGPRTVIIIIIILLLIPATFLIKIPYNISGSGLLVPAMEWRLEKTADGTIINTLINNLNNTIPSFSATEFQRGDHVVFEKKNPHLDNRIVNEGDTIGSIYSHLERYRLLELKGDLQEKLRLRQVTLTGETPQRIAAVQQEMMMAQTDFETEQKLFERAQTLHEQDVISQQEFELALNSYNLKKQRVNITRANYEVVMAGSKQEEVDRIDAIIDAINEQIVNVNERLEAFTILSPISGMLSPRIGNSTETENLARVIHNDQMVLLIPVDLNHLQYIEEGMTVTIKFGTGKNNIQGTIVFIDNSIQQFDQRQTIFIGSLFNNEDFVLKPNQKVKGIIEYGEITIAEYLKRLSETIYHN